MQETQETGFNPWVRKTPWKGAWQPTQVLLPGEPHGQRSLVGYGPWGHKELNTTEATWPNAGWIIVLQRCPCPNFTSSWTWSFTWERLTLEMWLRSLRWGDYSELSNVMTKDKRDRRVRVRERDAAEAEARVTWGLKHREQVLLEAAEGKGADCPLVFRKNTALLTCFRLMTFWAIRYMFVAVWSLSHAWSFWDPPWTIACQVLLTMGFPRQEYWRRLPFPFHIYIYICIS